MWNGTEWNPTGGISDYADITGKPSIGGVPLRSGNNTLEELGLQPKGEYATQEQGDTAQATADTAQNTANLALPKAGGTLTGVLTAGGTQVVTTKQVRNIYFGTTELATEATLATGTMYFQYE